MNFWVSSQPVAATLSLTFFHLVRRGKGSRSKDTLGSPTQLE